jgi:hypothetical protein
MKMKTLSKLNTEITNKLIKSWICWEGEEEIFSLFKQDMIKTLP